MGIPLLFLIGTTPSDGANGSCLSLAMLEVCFNRSFDRGFMHALSVDKLRMDGTDYTPTGMQEWSRIVFRRDVDRERKVVTLDDLIDYLPKWGQ